MSRGKRKPSAPIDAHIQIDAGHGAMMARYGDTLAAVDEAFRDSTAPEDDGEVLEFLPTEE